MPVVAVAIWVSSPPIGWHDYVGPVILGNSIKILITTPSNPGIVVHDICQAFIVTSRHIVQNWVRVRVVEYRVGCQTARIICLSNVANCFRFEGTTVAIFNCVCRNGRSGKLVGVEGFRISSMVLIEVGKFIVE